MRSNMNLTATLAVATAFLAVGTVQAQTLKMTPELKALAAAADKEGQVIVKYSSNFFDGGRGVKIYTDSMNKAFGTKVKVVWAPGGSMPEIGNEIAVSLKNNLPAPTDLYTGFSRNMAAFLKFDLFQTAPWKSYDPDRLTDRMIERDTYVKAYSATLGFSYNTDLVKSNPERVSDFLKPEFKGKIATTAFGAGFEQLSSKEAWGPEKTLEFARQFAQQVGGFMLCPEAERISSGEFLAFVTDCGGGSMVKAGLQGAPVRRVVTPDYPMISYFYHAVPKNAPNPNAAKLFITYLHTEAGQADMWDLHQNDLHLYPESRQRDKIQAVEKKFNITFKDADIDWQETNEAGNAAQREVVKIFQSSGR